MYKNIFSIFLLITSLLTIRNDKQKIKFSYKFHPSAEPVEVRGEQ